MSAGKSRKIRRLTALLGAGVIACGALTACGSDSGTPTINVYGSTSDAGFDKILDDCNKAAAGKYKIVPNLIPSDADSQREQFVRRLAAHDDGMDVLGMDVTWTAEFAEAGWIRELTGAQKQAATEGVLQPPIDTATWKNKLYAIPRSTNVQLLWYRKSLVPKPPKTWTDVLKQAKTLKARGQALRHRHHRGPVRGLRGGLQHDPVLARRHARQQDQHQGDRQRQDRPGAGDPQGAGHGRVGQQVAVEQPGARGVRADAERRGRLHHELALRPQRHEGSEQEGRRRPGRDQASRVRAGRGVPGHARWAELRGQHLQQAPEAGLRGSHVPEERAAPARRCAQPRGQRAGAGERLPGPEVQEGLPLRPGHPGRAEDRGPATGDAALPEHLDHRVDDVVAAVLDRPEEDRGRSSRTRSSRPSMGRESCREHCHCAAGRGRRDREAPRE